MLLFPTLLKLLPPFVSVPIALVLKVVSVAYGPVHSVAGAVSLPDVAHVLVFALTVFGSTTSFVGEFFALIAAGAAALVALIQKWTAAKTVK